MDNLNENVNEEVVNTEINTEEPTSVAEETPKKKSKKGLLLIVLLLLVACGVGAFFLLNNNKEKNDTEKKNKTETKKVESAYKIKGYNLSEFDLLFLKDNNNKKNIIYSPLSIKYALEMLSEGASGETKTQIDDIIGEYSAKTYTNSKNLSFANALFVKNSFKDNVKTTYVDNLKTKYNADVIYDSFSNANTVNSWVNNKTNKLINGLVDDATIKDLDFVLVNALAIDMEWVNPIQSKSVMEEENEDEIYDSDYLGYYAVSFPHEKFGKGIGTLDMTGYSELKFNNSINAKSVEFGAVANKYDIITELGEDNIRNTVSAAYKKFLEENPCEHDDDPDLETYMAQYMKDIKSNYKHVSSSTDFTFYYDSDVQVFAKDLKNYNGVTLQYIGIMPTQISLDEYVNTLTAKDMNTILDGLKGINLDSFEDGYVTDLTGFVPMFKYDYSFDLKPALNKIGVINVFDSSKADLNNLANGNAHIAIADHKATIEFSNEGIKAAAATSIGGMGNESCDFDYIYDVPIKKIDLIFNKPFMYIIRDKDTGEVWFTGMVYEPTKITNKDKGW